MTDPKELAKTIIENNQYLTLACVDENGNPWAAVVTYAYDNDYNFYWVSPPNTKHQENIKLNSIITFAIFDSHVNWGEGVGVQIEAKVEKVKLSGIPKAHKAFFSRDYPYGKQNVLSAYGEGLKGLLKGKIYSFYKAIPVRIWVPDFNADIDARVEVYLK